VLKGGPPAMSEEDVMEDTQKQIQDQGRKSQQYIVGYQTAITLWLAYAQEIWSLSNIMLVANSILVGASAVLLTATTPIPMLAFIFSLGGIILSLIWFLIAKREHLFRRYFMYSAREMEDEHLDSTVGLLRRLDEFMENSKISFNQTKQPTIHPMKFNRMLDFSSTGLSYAICLTFIVIHSWVAIFSYKNLPPIDKIWNIAFKDSYLSGVGGSHLIESSGVLLLSLLISFIRIGGEPV
jgi:hypothetical protein